MPLYEYQCRKCNARFELLVRQDTLLKCPSCGSSTIEKILSVFATPTSHAQQGAGLCPAVLGGEGPCSQQGRTGACAGGTCPFT